MLGFSSLLDDLERSPDMPEWARRARMRILRDVTPYLTNHDRFRYERLASARARSEQELITSVAR
jgi:hypothetical protein